MKQTHPEPPTDLKAEGAQPRTAAQQLIGFTNNLVATSVVVVVALVVGTQLISLWRPGDTGTAPVGVVSAWPTIEDCAIEFGDRPYSLIRRQINSDKTGVVTTLRENCQEILNTAPTPNGPIGNAEQRMIIDAEQLKPLATGGNWRIFQVKNPEGQSIPMVIGLRDDCQGPHQTRMVTWGLAIATNESAWNLFICSTSHSLKKQTTEFANLIPPECRRTLSISSEGGSKLIGFAGGDAASVKQFFNRFCERNHGKQSSWKQDGENWQCSVTELESINSGGVRVQFSVDARLKLRGLLVVEPNTKMGKPE